MLISKRVPEGALFWFCLPGGGTGEKREERREKREERRMIFAPRKSALSYGSPRQRELSTRSGD